MAGTLVTIFSIDITTAARMPHLSWPVLLKYINLKFPFWEFGGRPFDLTLTLTGQTFSNKEKMQHTWQIFYPDDKLSCTRHPMMLNF